MKKEEALQVWFHEYGDNEYAHDFSGRKIKKDDYNVQNQVGWVVSYICPLSHGGKKNADNMIILHHSTNYEKADNYPDFEVVGVKYTIKYDDKDDFYYIEKVMEN